MKKNEKNDSAEKKNCAFSARMILSVIVLSFITLISFGKNDLSAVPDSQPRVVSGTVTEDTGEPLLGATVIVKGTSVGTVTDLNGRFSFTVPAAAEVLVFSYVGMSTQEVTIGNQLIMNVILSGETLGLDEVVVVGYGVQKKESVVGAITQTNRETLERRGGVTNLSAALSGQIPGVTVMQRGGQPGRDEPIIYIRGLSTWNEGQPLLLVDGLERPINDIDVSEIESISVLKDASATAVFGVKGANGVILITTRRGKEGAAKFSASVNRSVKTISKMTRVMDSYESFNLVNEMVENSVASYEGAWNLVTPYEIVSRYKRPQPEEYKYIYPNTDWVDALTNDFATDYRANLNISGGTRFVKYYGSLSYAHEGDIMYAPRNERGYNPGYSYNRVNYRANLDFRLTKTTDLVINLDGFNGIRNESNIFIPERLTMIFQSMPPMDMPVQHPDGTFGKNPFNTRQNNPAGEFWTTGIAKYNRTQMVSDLRLNQKLDFLTQGLSASARISHDVYMISSGPNIEDGGNVGNAIYKSVHPNIAFAQTAADSAQWTMYLDSNGTQGKYNEFDFQVNPVNQTAESVNSGALSRALFYQFSLNYSRTFSRNNISALALMNRRENASGASFPNYREDWVGRVTYNFDRRYFAEINAAYNGSEKFGPSYRFGFFPSLAIGWLMSNENFISADWLDELRIRGSVGKVGSDGGIPRWGYLDSWGYDPNTRMRFGRNRTFSAFPRYYEDVIANPDLRWETAIKYNMGLDLGLFSNKLRLGFDYFIDNREDIFLSAARRTIPATFGADPVSANLGGTQTKGFELEMSFRKTWQNDWSVFINQNITRARDVITQYEDAYMLPDYQKSVGFMINQTRSHVREENILSNWDEIMASTAFMDNSYKSPGEWAVIDYNADGIIDNYDIIPYGYSNNRPQNTYTTSLGFGYRNFSFMVQFYGVTNINQSVFHKAPYEGSLSASTLFSNNYWTPENPDHGYYSQPRLGQKNDADLFIFDGSYLRLKTMEISYRLPDQATKFLSFSNARVFMNGNNILFWSKLPIDIERGDIGFMDSNIHPSYRQFNFGINVDF